MKKEFYKLNVGEKFTCGGTEYMAIKTISLYPGGSTNTYNAIILSGHMAGQFVYCQNMDEMEVQAHDERIPADTDTKPIPNLKEENWKAQATAIALALGNALKSGDKEKVRQLKKDFHHYKSYADDFALMTYGSALAMELKLEAQAD